MNLSDPARLVVAQAYRSQREKIGDYVGSALAESHRAMTVPSAPVPYKAEPVVINNFEDSPWVTDGHGGIYLGE